MTLPKWKYRHGCFPGASNHTHMNYVPVMGQNEGFGASEKYFSVMLNTRD